MKLPQREEVKLEPNAVADRDSLKLLKLFLFKGTGLPKGDSES